MAKTNPKQHSVLKRIEHAYDHFTPAQKAIAEYMLHHPESLLFMSIRKMSQATQVSMASIVRFCNALGFTGYPHLMEEIRQELRGELSALGRFQVTRTWQTDMINESDDWANSAFSRVVSHEIDNLKKLTKLVKVKQFNQSVELIQKADRILVLGFMASASLAAHMGRMLCKIIPAVDVVDGDGVLNSAKLMQLSSRSVAVVIAFPRYPAATVRLAKSIASRGTQIISITDSHLSPVSRLGTITFHIPIGIPGFIDAYAGPLTLINALCASVAEKNPSKSKSALKAFDDMAIQNKIFDKQVWRGRPRKGETSEE
jgi:DNA-binding MurR/RpiR family transcriptional regulator